MKEFCKCNSSLIMLDLEKLLNKCPICNLEKKIIKGGKAERFLRVAKELKKEAGK